MMDIPESEVIGLIFQLLPGFISAWIFYGLTAHPQKSPFERTIQALIFTGLIQSIVLPIGWLFVWIGGITGWTFGVWTQNVSYFVSVVVSLFFGVGVSACANSNVLHKWLSDISNGRITRRTSYPSEWFSAFMTRKRMVYLHLHDGRRLYGWPQEWPDNPTAGHFVLALPEWILEDNSRLSLIYTEWLLIPATDVRMVEFEKEGLSQSVAENRSEGTQASAEESIESEESIRTIEQRSSTATNGEEPLSPDPDGESKQADFPTPPESIEIEEKEAGE